MPRKKKITAKRAIEEAIASGLNGEEVDFEAVGKVVVKEATVKGIKKTIENAKGKQEKRGFFAQFVEDLFKNA